MIKISDKEFKILTDYLHDNFGLNMIKKRTLIESRLNNYLERQGFKDYTTYFDYAFNDKSGKEVGQIINFLTTNYSYFMREWEHFRFFRDNVMQEMQKTIKNNDLRIWSAGCSTGQEPYTLAMLISDILGDKRKLWDARVLATDISLKALDKAIVGEYEAEAVVKVPSNWKRSYFTELSNGKWGVKDDIKKEVIFRRFNLIEEAFPFKRRFHVIFCRNVMIYFDAETKQELIQKFYDATEPGGYLFIGQSESLSRNETGYQYVMPSVYRKVR